MSNELKDMARTIQDSLSSLAGTISFLRARVEALEGENKATLDRTDQLTKSLGLHEKRIADLEGKARTKTRNNERWVDYDREMKSKFMEKADDGSDWEPWCLVYWFRWLRRSTRLKATVTSWADYKVQVEKVTALVETLGSIVAAKNYLEYIVLGPPRDKDFNLHQATSGGCINRYSGQVDSWIDDRKVEETISRRSQQIVDEDDQV